MRGPWKRREDKYFTSIAVEGTDLFNNKVASYEAVFVAEAITAVGLEAWYIHISWVEKGGAAVFVFWFKF